MTSPTPAGDAGAQPQQPGDVAVTGVVSDDQPGQQGNVPAGTQPVEGQADGQVEGQVEGQTEAQQNTEANVGADVEGAEPVQVYLSAHWTDPRTGRSYDPKQSAWVSPDQQASLRGARYLLSDEAIAELRAEQEKNVKAEEGAEDADEAAEGDQQQGNGEAEQRATRGGRSGKQA